jgi:hypothetical protein
VFGTQGPALEELEDPDASLGEEELSELESDELSELESDELSELESDELSELESEELSELDSDESEDSSAMGPTFAKSASVCAKPPIAPSPGRTPMARNGKTRREARDQISLFTAASLDARSPAARIPDPPALPTADYISIPHRDSPSQAQSFRHST